MPTIVRDGIELHYELSGSGPPIVLTHSFLCDGSMFREQVVALSRSHRLINIDMRGHGRSGPSESPFTIYDLADDVLAVLDAEGVASAVWMGLSIGGFLSMRAALRNPERVRALVLLDTDAGPESAWKKVKYTALKWGVQTLGPRYIVPSLLPIFLGATTLRQRPAIRDEYERIFMAMRVRSISRGIDAIVARDDLLKRLHEIKVPTLVIVGEEDQPLPVWKSRRIAAAIPGAELVVIPQAGHLASIENPAPVTAAVTRFLAQLGTAGARARPQDAAAPALATDAVVAAP
jgi:3-oxoadipate enol-lactonase